MLVCRATHVRTRNLSQGCQVGLFEDKHDKFGLFLNSWPRNLLSSWPFCQKVYLVKSKIWPFFKTEFGLFQLQAPGNPDLSVLRTILGLYSPSSLPRSPLPLPPSGNPPSPTPPPPMGALHYQDMISNLGN